MNMFNLDVTQRCLIAECWCPVEELDEIQRALTRGTVSMDGDIHVDTVYPNSTCNSICTSILIKGDIVINEHFVLSEMSL
jgi:hypothetical protein